MTARNDDPSTEIPTSSAARDWFTPARIRMLVIVGAVLLIGIIVALLWKGVTDDAASERWDKYADVRATYELGQDNFWQDPAGTYAAELSRYIRALEQFIEEEGDGSGDVLTAQARWRLARTAADLVLTMKDVLDPAKRAPIYKKAIAQLEKLQSDYPDFPLNSSMFRPEEFPTMTRKFIDFLQKNQAWEAKYLPKAQEADGTHTIVVRTTRGDVRFKLYREGAPKWTEQFLQRASAGFWDGTAIFGKREVGTTADPRERTLRGGHPDSRGAAPYDSKAHVAFASGEQGGGLMPGESRNRIPHDRGIVAAWHDGGTTYDDRDQFLFVLQRSPMLDFDYTPIGKISDPQSLDTLDRMWDQPTWNEDPLVRDDTGETRGILDYLQAPVVIEKVLVFDASGTLVKAGEALPNRAAATSTEQTLSGLKVDAYKVAVPERAAPPEEDTEEDDKPGDE